MRFLALLIVLGLLAADGVRAEETDEPLGWTVSVRRLDGSERRLWYLALVFHKTPKVVTLVVAPAATAGDEGAGIDVERIERSAVGDLHQITAWAERLCNDAQGWKRPSLRDRPPASPHVIGVVRARSDNVRVENAEHGGADLKVGDCLFVEDVLLGPDIASFTVELLGQETLWHTRTVLAELTATRGARLGLRRTGDALGVILHHGVLEGVTRTGSLPVRTDRAEYAVGTDTTFRLTRGADDRLDIRQGTVQAAHAGVTSTVAGGSTLVIHAGGDRRILPFDEAVWRDTPPAAESLARNEALRVVARLVGTWRGQPLNAQLTLGDDGQWRSYERQSGRSVNKAGSWEPRPGGLVELTHVWTPHRSTVPRTDVYRYVLDGNVLRRLVPGGPLYLKP